MVFQALLEATKKLYGRGSRPGLVGTEEFDEWFRSTTPEFKYSSRYGREVASNRISQKKLIGRFEDL